MSSEEAGESIVDTPPVPPRDDLVKTAAQFLQSPKVYKSPMDMKTAFLKKKGLSDAEIELAIKMSEEMVQTRASKQVQFSSPHVAVDIPQGYGYSPVYWSHQSRWLRYRDIANTIALFGGLIYATFWFYKKYISPYLFGLGRKSLDSRLTDLETNVSVAIAEIKNGISEIRQEFDKMTERRSDIVNKQVEELKSEITSLKKLLLNRKQFPSATVTGPLSIPAWQRAASPPAEKEAEEEGNGSGTNGSDSSLEMIKE